MNKGVTAGCQSLKVGGWGKGVGEGTRVVSEKCRGGG